MGLEPATITPGRNLAELLLSFSYFITSRNSRVVKAVWPIRQNISPSAGSNPAQPGFWYFCEYYFIAERVFPFFFWADMDIHKHTAGIEIQAVCVWMSISSQESSHGQGIRMGKEFLDSCSASTMPWRCWLIQDCLGQCLQLSGVLRGWHPIRSARDGWKHLDCCFGLARSWPVVIGFAWPAGMGLCTHSCVQQFQCPITRAQYIQL